MRAAEKSICKLRVLTSYELQASKDLAKPSHGILDMGLAAMAKTRKARAE